MKCDGGGAEKKLDGGVTGRALEIRRSKSTKLDGTGRGLSTVHSAAVTEQRPQWHSDIERPVNL